jgi:DUF1680 family protein
VSLRQEHDYPWDGQIRLDLQLEQPASFAISMRAPGWCREPSLRVNGKRIDCTAGYVGISRTWHSGDRIELDLPMPVERVYAHPQVAEDAGRVALQRGPIVYCLEGVDNGAPLHTIALPRSAQVDASFDPDCLGGLVTLRAEALAAQSDGWDGALYRRGDAGGWKRQPIVAVPYATWDNRAAGQMQVWIREAAVDEHTRDS